MPPRSTERDERSRPRLSNRLPVAESTHLDEPPAVVPRLFPAPPGTLPLICGGYARPHQGGQDEGCTWRGGSRSGPSLCSWGCCCGWCRTVGFMLVYEDGLAIKWLLFPGSTRGPLERARSCGVEESTVVHLSWSVPSMCVLWVPLLLLARQDIRDAGFAAVGAPQKLCSYSFQPVCVSGWLCGKHGAEVACVMMHSRWGGEGEGEGEGEGLLTNLPYPALTLLLL